MTTTSLSCCAGCSSLPVTKMLSSHAIVLDSSRNPWRAGSREIRHMTWNSWNCTSETIRRRKCIGAFFRKISGKMEKFLRNFAFGLVKAFEKRVLPVWRYLVHNLAMIDFAQPRVRATADWVMALQQSNGASDLQLIISSRLVALRNFAFYTLMGRLSEIVMPHEILKINHICTCSMQKCTPRQVLTHAHVKINFDNAKSWSWHSGENILW